MSNDDRMKFEAVAEGEAMHLVARALAELTVVQRVRALAWAKLAMIERSDERQKLETLKAQLAGMEEEAQGLLVRLRKEQDAEDAAKPSE